MLNINLLSASKKTFSRCSLCRGGDWEKVKDAIAWTFLSAIGLAAVVALLASIYIHAGAMGLLIVFSAVAFVLLFAWSLWRVLI